MQVQLPDVSERCEGGGGGKGGGGVAKAGFTEDEKDFCLLIVRLVGNHVIDLDPFALWLFALQPHECCLLSCKATIVELSCHFETLGTDLI